MKHGSILLPAQDAYLDRLLPPREALLREMEEAAAAEGIPIADPGLGRLLQVLARSSGARRILEIGTAIGYGTLCLARGAPEAQVVSIDTDRERLARARAYLERAGVADRVELIEGPALEVLSRLEPPFDLAYVDAVKREYRRYLDLLLPRLRVGGLVVVDNLLWGGKVADPPEEPDGEPDGDPDGEDPAADPDADALRAFNPYLMIHPQLTAVILPLGDGIGLATKTRPLVSELGGPF